MFEYAIFAVIFVLAVVVALVLIFSGMIILIWAVTHGYVEIQTHTTPTGQVSWPETHHNRRVAPLRAQRAGNS